MVVKVKQIQPKAVVDVKTPQGAESKVEEKVGSPVTVPVPYAQVTVEAGTTQNLGNYSSVRFGVSLTLPCAVENIDGVYAAAKTWVDDRMEVLMADFVASKAA